MDLKDTPQERFFDVLGLIFTEKPIFLELMPLSSGIDTFEVSKDALTLQNAPKVI